MLFPGGTLGVSMGNGGNCWGCCDGCVFVVGAMYISTSFLTGEAMLFFILSLCCFIKSLIFGLSFAVCLEGVVLLILTSSVIIIDEDE